MKILHKHWNLRSESKLKQKFSIKIGIKVLDQNCDQCSGSKFESKLLFTFYEMQNNSAYKCCIKTDFPMILQAINQGRITKFFQMH